MFTIRLEGVEEEIRRLELALDEQLRPTMLRATEEVAQEAQNNHPYTNRSGDLEANTKAGPADGRFMSGTLAGSVVADTDYAEYVDSRPGFEFLQPAFDRVQSRLDTIVQLGLDAAAKRAGWGT